MKLASAFGIGLILTGLAIFLLKPIPGDGTARTYGIVNGTVGGIISAIGYLILNHQKTKKP